MHRRPNRTVLAALIATAALIAPAAAPSVSAHTRVDPTTLTPPLKPFRICYQDGPWVKCDTSSVSEVVNEPAGFDLSCGTVYVSLTETGMATRWYMDGLLVERNAVDKMRGTWSLSPDGSGRTVVIAADFGWHEHFVVPGDLSSDVEVSHGNYVRIIGLGSIGMASGTFKADGTFRGMDMEDVPEKDAALCARLAP